MTTLLNQTPNGVYLFNPAVNSTQLFEAINACLCKAEALAAIAVTTDFENYNASIINNYLWAISDLVYEAKWLHDKTSSWGK